MRTGCYEEWAIAFTCLCIALGHDARLCIDEMNDAWTEIYFKELRRWVAVDSYMGLFDSPLTGEKATQKQMDYIFAFS